MDFPGQGSLNRMLTVVGDQAGQVRPGPGLKRAADAVAGMTEAEEIALEKSAKEFEGVFLNTLLKAMRQTVPVNDLFNGDGATKFYRQMHDAEIAKSLATGHSGMGISDMIVRQLSREAQENPLADQIQGPPAPKALARYRDISSGVPETAARVRLSRLAASQGTAVADTLKAFEREIESAAQETGLEPALILSVVMEESGGDPGARSDKGALGLMQLMPETALELGVRERTNAAQNLHGGSRYLAQMLEKFGGNIEVALAAYNAGPGTVERLGGKVPDYPETQRYIKRVLDRYQQLGGGTHLASAKP